ncbi:hypothetical protein [Photobacterium leiognathi]|uniref:hypothetical protein n=1 Tax=Photobacterium leiognathi TaxID=553611 RepID=UPI0029826E60|nr:hypothetical protein [Photobacterium leiognathi]
MKSYAFLSVFFIFLTNPIQIGQYGVERYIPILLGTNVAFFIFIINKNGKADTKLITGCYLFFALIIGCLAIGSSKSNEFFYDFTKIYLCFLLFYLLAEQIRYLSFEKISKLISTSATLAILVLSVELLIRILTTSNVISVLLGNFYELKVNSPFFSDTNAVGLFALSYFIVIYFYKDLTKDKIKYNIMLSLLFIFILTSLSRAAIITAIFLVLYKFYLKCNSKLKLILNFFLFLCFFVSLHILVKFVGDDGSGATKLLIIESVINKYDQINLINLLFGFGITDGSYIYSYQEGEYSHLLITMLLGHVGVIGLFLYFIFFIYIALISKGRTLFASLPFFVVGLSYLHPFLESIFFSHGVIMGVYLKLKNEKFIPVDNYLISKL